MISNALKRRLPVAGYIWLAVATSAAIAYTYADYAAEERAHRDIVRQSLIQSCENSNELRAGVRFVLNDRKVPEYLLKPFLPIDCEREYAK